MQKLIIIASVCFTFALADVSHLFETTTTPQPPPHPYAFEYAAGRFPGHVDRTHAEVSDGSGTIKGAFSYVDPRGEVRSIEYVANEYGFYPSLSHPQDAPRDTEAVRLATQRHFDLYSRIAESHQSPELFVTGPRDTASVEKAKQKHFTLYEKIAAEHAQIGAQQEAERLAFEATSIKTDTEEQYLK